jgi:hypothetical protein
MCKHLSLTNTENVLDNTAIFDMYVCMYRYNNSQGIKFFPAGVSGF